MNKSLRLDINIKSKSSNNTYLNIIEIFNYVIKRFKSRRLIKNSDKSVPDWSARSLFEKMYSISYLQ